MDAIKKTYSTVIKQPSDGIDSRNITFVISDESEDSDGDIIMADGWDFNRFLKNPICMGFHEYDEFPYGKFIKIEKDLRSNPRRVIGTVHFPTAEELGEDGQSSEHAKNIDMAYNMCKNGYLNTVSVGCYYKEAETRQDYPAGTPDWMRGKKVTKAELLEVSLVPIPSNPNALSMIEADKGIDTKMKHYIVKSFNNHNATKATIPFKHYPLADEGTEWDGPKVVADSEVEDLKMICAYFDGDGEVKGDYKLPHHLTKADGYKTVKAGVVAAVGAMLGARGGVRIPESDIEKVKAHLRRHYDEFELEWPEEKSAWIEQAKSIGLDIEQKYGARLSADTMAKIDDLEKCVKELDEAVAACKTCRDNMEKRIKALRDGVEPDETEPEPEEPKDNEKAVMATVIKVVE